METRQLKSGKQKFPVYIEPGSKGKLKIRFDWAPGNNWTRLKDEIKAMRGARFHKETTGGYWVINDCQANIFALDYLDVDRPNPYDQYDQEIEPVKFQRPLYLHQQMMLGHVLAKKQCILAAEMGTGKTLVVIELLDHIKPSLAWYIAPKFALNAIKMEFSKWGLKKWPVLLSYARMRKLVYEEMHGKVAPDVVIFDESAYLKTPVSQRSDAAQILADGMRADHEDPYIILMSGAPAPKSPKDWWKQCEIARPGYLKEGHPVKFERRLALIESRESPTGGSYPKLITWWDDEKKCRHCGEYENAARHNPEHPQFHFFEPSINEVEHLHHRLNGLVQFIFKKDCLDLPDKIYREIQCEVSPSLKRAAALITKTAKRTIEALTRLRELSDGFQYADVEDKENFKDCPRCQGTGQAKEYEPERLVTCPNCNGDGLIFKTKRISNTVKTPKDAILEDLLDENEENGRIVIYGGFTATIDRVVELCKRKKWVVIRVDGQSNKRGGQDGMWTSSPMSEPLKAFQDKSRAVPKIAFVAHPATAKTALTLTESSMIVYYSNTFIGDDRIQSEDRIHRIGMDVNKGATIVDILNLPSDKYVLNNLKSKRRLQGITLGDFQREMGGLLES